MAYRYKYGEFQIGDNDLYDFTDKSKSVGIYISYMLNRTQQIFEYDGLPDTIPQRMLELYIQTNGNCCIADVNGSLYAFTGNLGGEPDAYYMPTIYTVANPALKFSKSLKISDECVVIPNDSMYLGLIPMFKRYATQLVENDITMNLVDINTRIQSLLSAPDERTRASAEQYLAKVAEGKLGIISETAFFDGIKAQPFAQYSNDRIVNLIEYHQYLKASWFNELGLQSNYNMKRESINSNEAQLNEDALLPLIDDMLLRRQEAIDKVNNMFGTNITVKLNSSWEDNQLEIALEHKVLESSVNGNDVSDEILSTSNGVVDELLKDEPNDSVSNEDVVSEQDNEEEDKDDEADKSE